ncbi:MAG: hypothetical protein HYR51_09570 [Candidatus Rokubacteria bacterium]|nr:hypothetical protein [Candidatus Rokubacteria bacterium]
MKVWLVALAVALVAAGPAWADHRTPAVADEPRDPTALVEEPPVAAPSSSLLDVEIKVGKDGFRLGGRLFGPAGVAGAWLNGQLESNGVVLDGRVQDEQGRARSFKLDAEMIDWLTRAGWQWLIGRSLAE